MTVVWWFPLKVATIILGYIFSRLPSALYTWGLRSIQTPVDALMLFFQAEHMINLTNLCSCRQIISRTVVSVVEIHSGIAASFCNVRTFKVGMKTSLFLFVSLTFSFMFFVLHSVVYFSTATWARLAGGAPCLPRDEQCMMNIFVSFVSCFAFM